MNKELRNTLILAVIAIGAGSYMYFVESKKPEKPDTETVEEGEKVIEAEAKDVEEISIEGTASMTINQTSPDVWQVAGGGKTYDADSASVGDLVSAFGMLRARKLAVEPGAKDADFGFDTPRTKLTLKRKGLPPVTMLLGGESPISGSRYIRIGTDSYVVKSHELNPFERTVEDLRNKKIVKTDPSKVFKLEISWTGAIPENRMLIREKDGWKFARQLDGKVDVNHLEDFLSELRLLRVSKFSGLGEEAFKDYGIDIARLDASLYGENGELLDRVRFGVRDPQTEGTWVWSDKFGELVQISKFSMDQMPQTAKWLTVNENPPEPEGNQGDSMVPAAPAEPAK